ncbi:MAG TPA: amidase family protein [Alphaproteobacteria bacterium]|nr:amidase family protein [Alphaproteobacteria bacterium]
MTGDPALTRLTAVEALAALRRREIRPLDLVEAAADRIAAVDGSLNALPTLCLDRAREHAERLEASGGDLPLGGLPLAIKDLAAVKGVRTTFGSPIYADHVPARSDLLVETLEGHGGIVVAKSNTPEFGAGAQTFNAVFGATVNPWNTAMTCGGSSGGAAVALAAGMVWLAHGSDLGGSLRTPASFCSVVGLRPSPGRVARGPQTLPFDDLSVDGPMARTVEDVALMLDAMVGQHGLDPLSQPAPEGSFREAARRRQVPGCVAYSPDLGQWPVDPEVRAATDAAVRRLEALGVTVEEAAPDFSDATETFHTLRAALFAALHAPLLENARDKLKPDVVWNVEAGLKLTGEEVARALRARGALYNRVRRFFERYDLLLAPSAIVPPFPVEQRYVDRVGDHLFANYIEWLGITYGITLTSCPALSLPCGFTPGGLPVGLQMVGPPRGEAPLLAAAAALEAELDIVRALPIDPKPPVALR